MRTWKNLAYLSVTSSLVAVTLVGTAPQATASEPASNEPTYTTTINEAGSSSSSQSDADVTSVNGFKLKKAMKNKVVAFVEAKGMPKAEQKNARSITIKKARRIKTSYVNIYGQEVWHMKFYPAGYTFYKGADGWYHDPECNNKVVIKTKKRPPKGHIFVKGKVRVVKKFKFSGKASASIAESAVASSTARSVGYLLDHNGQLVRDGAGNPTITCEAGAVGSGRADVSASGSARIKGRVFFTYQSAYEALLEGAAKNLELDLQSKGYTKLNVKGEVRAKAKGSAEADASAFAWCKNTQLPTPPPPPVNYEAPSVDVTPVACVEEGQSRDVKVTVSNPNASDDTARLTFRGQTVEKAIAAHGQTVFTFTGVGAGTYSGTALLVKANKSASFTVSVEKCKTPPPPPVDNPPSIEIKGSPAHLYVNGNAAVFFEAWDPDGDDISVEVSASGSGWVAGLVEVNTRWDGTPCPSGRTCYRATAWAGASPGTLTITGKVTAKGKEDTASASFPVVADEF